MLNVLEGKEKEEHFFEMVRHWNIGSDLLADKSERIFLATMNLQASVKAKKATAYELAKDFAENGLKLLEGEQSADHHNLLTDLRIECAENEYMTGEIGAAENLLALVLESARTKEEKARVYELKVIIYCHLNQMEDSVQAGVTALKLLGMKIPSKITRLNVVVEFSSVFFRLRGRKSADIVELPVMTDSTQQIISRILIYMASSAYFTDKNIFDFICLRGFNILLQHGLTDSSSFSMLGFGVALAGDFEAYRSAFDFANGAFTVNEKYPNSQVRAKTYGLYGIFFSHWFQPYNED